MTILSADGQQRAREALRKVDDWLITEIAAEGQLKKLAQDFRDHFFGAFKFIESESMTLRELQIQVGRVDQNQIQVKIRGRQGFVLWLDPELAYDRKPSAANLGQGGETSALEPVELAARLFAVFAPPHTGLLRYYTVFGDGLWKRTTFGIVGDNIQSRRAVIPQFTADLLTLEAIDLLGYVCAVHPAWENLAAISETVTTDNVMERTFTKMRLTGLASPRRPS